MLEENQAAVIPSAKLPIKLGVTKQALAKLKTKYAVVPDATTKEGYQLIIKAKRELVPLRTGVEAERKIQVAAAVKHQSNVNSVAKTIKETIEAIEAPLYAAKKAVDDAKAEEKRLAEEKEERRIMDIEGKVEGIYAMTEGLLGADLAKLTEQLNEIKSITITEDEYMEFVEPAKLALNSVMATLTNAVEARRGVEEQQAANKAEQEKLVIQQEEQRRTNEAAQKKLDEQQAEFDRQKKEHEDKVAADKKAEADKVEAQRIEDERIEREALAEKEAEKRAVELKARMPEDQKLREYAQALELVIVPFIDDTALLTIQSRAVTMVEDIVKFVNENTQSTE